MSLAWSEQKEEKEMSSEDRSGSRIILGFSAVVKSEDFAVGGRGTW